MCRSVFTFWANNFILLPAYAKRGCTCIYVHTHIFTCMYIYIYSMYTFTKISLNAHACIYIYCKIRIHVHVYVRHQSKVGLFYTSVFTGICLNASVICLFCMSFVSFACFCYLSLLCVFFHMYMSTCLRAIYSCYLFVAFLRLIYTCLETFTRL